MSQSITLFVTGTDTEVGKTYMSAGLLSYFNARGCSTIGLKPVASGAHQKNGACYNTDALMLQQAASVKLPYAVVNPFLLEAPVAPHIAAAYEGVALSAQGIIHWMQGIWQEHPADVYIVEGVGGWHVPLNDTETMAHVVQPLKLPVILVVGIRLGCLNHAILTEQAVGAMQIPIYGWIANILDAKSPAIIENINTLKTWLASPHLGTISEGADVANQLPTDCFSSLVSPDDSAMV